MRAARATSMTFLVWAAGCGDEVVHAPISDAARDVPPPDIAAPDEPVPPSRPRFTPCQAGWVPQLRGDVTRCAPFGGEEPPSCAGATQAIPSERACVAVGTPCGDDPFTTHLPKGRPIVFVRSDYVGPEEGTRERPFISLRAAVEAAESGAFIALAKGDYAGLDVDKDLTLAGACPGATHIHRPPRGVVVLSVTGATVSLRDVSVDGEGVARGIVTAGSRVAMDGLVVENTIEAAIAPQAGTTATLRDSVIRHNDRGGVPNGRALNVVGGSTLTVERVELTDLEDAALATSQEGSALEATDCYVHGTSRDDAFAMFGANGTSLSVRTSVVRDVSGVALGGLGASLRLVQSLVETTGGPAILPLDSTCHLERVEIVGGGTLGAGSQGGSMRLVDVIVRDTVVRGDAVAAQSMAFFEGASAQLERVVIEDGVGEGVLVSEGATVSIEDLVVRRISAPRSFQVAGLEVEREANVTVSRALFDDVTSYGVKVHGVGTTLLLADVHVRALRAQAETGEYGVGVSAQSGVALGVERLWIEGARTAGLTIGGGGTEAHVTDLVVEDTSGRASDGYAGRGIEVADGARLTLDRAVIARNRELALMGFGAGSIIDASSVRISGTLGRACSVPGGSCEDNGLGVGLGCYDARCVLSLFEIASSSLCGVHLASADVVLTDGLIRDNLIGVCKEVGSLDVEALTERVEYRDNVSPIETRRLLVPDPAGDP